MKKILVILGGGRPKGNTRQLVDAFARGATDAGHEVEIVHLNKVQVNDSACQRSLAIVRAFWYNGKKEDRRGEEWNSGNWITGETW